MPDITMCCNDNCIRKVKCYRYMATPSKFRQAYTSFNNFENVDDCEHYIKYKEKENE